MEKGIRISGPPGIGKSVTTWLWACHQAYVQEKTVLWVHIRKSATYQVLLISGHEVRSTVLRTDQILDFIECNQSNIVILDGVTKESGHELCLQSAFNWKFNSSRLVVSVASLATKTNDEDDESIGVSRFAALPWSYAEYLDAIRDDAFFEQVKPLLRETTQNELGARRTSDERVELLDNKFYYAGHSARWMWATSLSSVVDKIERCLKRFNNAIVMLKGLVGDESADSVNHLMSGYSGGSFFTSHYIARQVLRKGDNEAVRLAYGIAYGLNNPSFTGWVVEMDFVKQVVDAANGGKELEVHNS